MVSFYEVIRIIKFTRPRAERIGEDMSTGSIRHNIEITDSADAERFVEALEKAKAESEEGMERKEIIDGLKDLIKDRESFITEGEPESWKTDTDKIFEHDKQVLEEAINTIEAQQQEIEQLQAQAARMWEALRKRKG